MSEKYTCTSCKNLQDKENFFKHSQTKSGLRLNRCKKCDTEYHRNRRQRRKKELLEYKGGKCQICSYDKYWGALEFHHTDPSKKDFEIGDGCRKSLEKLKAEIDKCILVCSNCHKEIHSKL